MIRLRRISVIVPLFLLVSAATASAECAWVLWEQVSTWTAASKNPEETQWGPVTTGSEQPICERSKANRIRERTRKLSSISRPKDTIVPIEDSALMWSWQEPDGTKGAQVFRFLCLPDTVDPRAPKAK